MATRERIHYLHDGSFEGFLTCVYLHYYEDRAAAIYPAENYQDTLLHRSRLVLTDPEKAETVYRAIEEKISTQALRRVYAVFLSNEPEKDTIAFRYLCLGFRIGCKLFSLHSDPIVFAAQQTERKVELEAHRLKGLVRFSAIHTDPSQEVLFAKIEPDHDVLELLGEHFSDRFKNEPFLLYDARRKKALLAQQGEWRISPLVLAADLPLTEEEEAYRRLWKKYFDTIAIEERKNPACQKRFMPVRYWKNLTEMQSTDTDSVFS